MVPGGLLALFGALLFRAISKTERGQRALVVARRNVPSWANQGLRLLPSLGPSLSQQRQAA
ncbi:MAG: hypothetical protein NVS2B9_08740 [Myxococcales bacterium]